jgi:transcriptional regulator with XRE-family HTH domain
MFDNDGFQKETGRLLRLNRKAAGMTQQEMVGRLGVNRATYVKMELGRSRVPLDIVWRVSIVLGVEVVKLIPERANNDSSGPLPVTTLCVV